MIGNLSSDQKYVRIALVLLLSFSVILFLLIVLFVFLIFFSTSGISQQQGESNNANYLLQEILPDQKGTSYGHVTLNKILPPDQFISYQNKDSGSFIIISKMTNSEYKCSGSCTCSPNVNNRRTTSVLSRSLFALFAAISSPVALKMAEETFRSQCSDEFSEECAPETIESDVSCEEESEEDRVVTPKEGEDLLTMFNCKGHCVKNRIRTPNGVAALEEYEKEVGCHTLKISKTLEVPDSAVFKTSSYSERNIDFIERTEFLALQEFSKWILGPFCKAQSKRSFLSSYTVHGEHKKQLLNMCKGVEWARPGKINYSNFECKKIDQRTRKKKGRREDIVNRREKFES